MFSCKRVSKCCHGKPQPSETNLQKEMRSTVAMPMPPTALKIKYTDLQQKTICWETNKGELVKVTFQPCLTIPINYYILKKLLLSQPLGFTLPINSMTKKNLSRFSHIGAQKTRSTGSEQYGVFQPEKSP